MFFSKKVVIIKGASSGIGEATAKLFAQRGALLVIHGRREDRLRLVSDECQKLYPTSVTSAIVLGDIENENVRCSLLATALKNYGRVDVLVNNAGFSIRDKEKEMTSSDLRVMLECHVVAPFDLCMKVLPDLEKTRGCVVNVGSVVGDRAFAYRNLPYAVSKAALHHMTKCFAIEVASKGIRVNEIAPGVVVTEMRRQMSASAGVESLIEHGKCIHPMRRSATSEEVANSIVFLASDASSLTTGVVLFVDGGLHAAGRQITL